MDAIILCGGFGTRLKSVIPNIPKPMAPVLGIPFLEFILKKLEDSEIKKVILAVGYKREQIIEYFGYSYRTLIIEYSVESYPLGTGGAIKKALNSCHTNCPILVLNGDTLFDINLKTFLEYHEEAKNDVSIALKYIERSRRFGLVRMDHFDRIVDFEEKTEGSGFINGGIYCLNNSVFNTMEKESFSFENEFLPNNLKDKKISGYISDGYFIDIGVPKQYFLAQKEFRKII